LISKWYEEQTQVVALLVSQDDTLQIKVSGRINGFSTSILISDGTREKGSRPPNYVLFPADFIKSFQYAEVKEMPLSPEELALLTTKHGSCSLSLLYESGTRLSIFAAD